MSDSTTRRAFACGLATLVVTVIDLHDATAVPPPPPGVPLPPAGKLWMDGRVSQNHGHVFAITIDDVDKAATKTYDLTGTSGHVHEVTITRDQFLELQQAKIVRLASTPYASHLHRIYAKVRVDPLPPDEVSACEVFIGGKDDHELVIPQSHLDAGASRTYDIQANSPHTHALTIESTHFARIKKGEKITVTTGAGDQDHHTHVVFLELKKPAKPPATKP